MDLILIYIVNKKEAMKVCDSSKYLQGSVVLMLF